jgi:hypothetical protein
MMLGDDRPGFAPDLDDDGTAQSPRDRFALRVAIVHGLSFAVVFVALNYAAPQFERLFIDFDTTLPAITQVALAFANWFDDYWFLAAVGWLVGIGAVAWLDNISGRGVARDVSFAWLIGVLLFLAFLVVAFFLPLVELIQMLS